MKKNLFFLLGITLLASCIPTPIKSNSIGDIYILTSSAKGDGLTHSLFKISSDCFIVEVKCPTPELVSAFPKDFAPYIWANMYWSPNGKYALLVDMDTLEKEGEYPIQVEKLILYNATNNSIKTLVSGYKYISGITWNPNSEWAAMSIKKTDDKDMQTIMVNPEGKKKLLPIQPASEAGYIPHILNGQVFDDNQHSIQWLNEKELLFIREQGELQTENSNQPPIVSANHLFKFNIQTNVETEIELPFRAYYNLSPDSTVAYFTKNKILMLYSFESGKVTEIKNFSLGTTTANWSPNSKWLIVCERGFSTYAITPDLKTKQKLMDGCSFYPTWMPDSDHVILFFSSNKEDTAEIIESHWFVASISEGGTKEIVIPGLDLRDRHINGIYVQPIKSLE